MKNFTTSVLSALLFSFGLYAQECNERFKDPVFEEVQVTEGVKFGEAKQLVDVVGPSLSPDIFNNSPSVVLINQTLYFDLYEPVGDQLETRPMIIFAFGGAFVFGTRKDDYVVDLCTRYAELGYVVAAIDYRLTRELALAVTKLEPDVAPRAVLKGAHDMKAAVRFFRNSAQQDNPYRIDENQIYVGGLSAGAFCATHTAYLTREDELPEILKPYAEENGGVEGLSGTPGVSSAVAGVISMSGALGEATWMEPGEVPIVSTHGTADEVVPYGSDSVTILGINYPVDGSSSIHKRADSIGVINAFYTYVGASHAPESSNEAYRDTGFAFTRDFMYDRVCEYYTATSVSEWEEKWIVSAYPNPTTDVLHIEGLKGNEQLEMLNVTGRNMNVKVENGIISVGHLPRGVYLLRVSSHDEEKSIKIIKK